MTTTNAIEKIKLFNKEKLEDQTIKLKNSTVYDKIQWILGINDVYSTQKKANRALAQTQKEYKDTRNMLLGISLFGIPLGLFNNILSNDLTNLGGVLIFVVTLVGSIMLAFATMPVIKKRLNQQKTGGIYHYVQTHPTPDFDKETFDTFKTCINDGNPIGLTDTDVLFDNEKFNTTVDSKTELLITIETKPETK